MAEIIVNLQGFGKYRIVLDLHDPSVDGSDADVWLARFCDDESGDCSVVYFEMEGDYEAWDIIDEAIQVYRLSVEDGID